MEQKSQQIQGQKESSQMLFSMTEIMFQVVALGFEHIVIFVFRLPTSPRCRRDLNDLGRVNEMVCNPGIVVDLKVI